MNVTLVTAGAEGLGPQYLSAMLKKDGHKVKLAFDPTLFDDKVFLDQKILAKLLNYSDDLVLDILESQPEIIGFTVISDIYSWANYVAKKLKKHTKAPVIFGGNHPTLVPETVIKNTNVDMICIGEGEHAFTELVNAISSGKPYDNIPNIWLKKGKKIIKNPLRPLIKNLDDLPFPDRSIFEEYINTKNSYLTMSGRGCLYTCSYCFNNPYKKLYEGKGIYLRRRSPENFIAELIRAKKRYKMEFIKIYDDIFTWSQKGWLKKFADLYRLKVRLPYFCLGHPKFLNEPTVKLLKRSGCEFIQIGIQTMDEKVRHESCERYETNEEILKMLSILDKYKLKYELDHIFGLPGDTESSYQFAARVYKSGKSLLKINTNILSYIPKTSIIDKSLKAKQIRKNDLKTIEKGQEGCRVTSGSERNKKRLNMYQNLLVLYKTIRLFPKPVLEVLLNYRLYRVFRYFDPWVGYLARLVCMDTIDKIYLKQELFLLEWWLTKKTKRGIRKLLSIS